MPKSGPDSASPDSSFSMTAAEYPVPTELDHENARIRHEIAERMWAEYAECLELARRVFGEGWRPSHRHFLVEKDEEARVRHTGEKPKAAATVYAVRNAASECRHFTVKDGVPTECAGYEDGFGAMLLEPHPSRSFEFRGKRCPVHRYSLCWAPFELYEPKSAEQLAMLRQSRERRKSEREERKWREENPLLAWLESQEETR